VTLNFSLYKLDSNVYFYTYVKSNSIIFIEARKLQGKMKHFMPSTLFFFFFWFSRLLNLRGGKTCILCYIIYLHFLTNNAVKGFKHNMCAFNPILNVTIFSCSVCTFRCCNVIVLSLYFLSFFYTEAGIA
jgi:hypothetical protein